MTAIDAVFVLPHPFADHPSFPEGILKRALEQGGFSVGVIERPEWQKQGSFNAFGRPRLFFAIVAGPVDSVVANWTASRKRRREDLYQEGGRAFFPGAPRSASSRIRPDRCIIVFANRLREAYPGVPIVVGGVEATMRRFSHYDFQEGAIRCPVLLDSRADLLVTGMGEKQLVAVARLLAAGHDASAVPGTARVEKSPPPAAGFVVLPAHEEVAADPARLLEMQKLMAAAAASGRGIVQPVQNRFVVQQPPQAYDRGDLDFVYGLPYARKHPALEKPTPALLMNLFSVTSHRGCFGGCAFCSIHGLQGRRVVSRSPESIAREIRSLHEHPRWQGIVSDIGGATAEMYGSDCSAAECGRASCLSPSTCRSLPAYGSAYLELLRSCRAIHGVRKVFVGSGLRHDLMLGNPDLLAEILRFHSGRFLRVAPEHTEEHVLRLMQKASFGDFSEFVRLFTALNGKMRRQVDLAAYLVVGLPGETEKDVLAMKRKLRALKLKHLDVQIFTPTPGTLATAMYVSGLGPDGRPVAVERSVRELERRKRLLLE